MYDNILGVDGSAAFSGTLGIGTTALSTNITGTTGQVQIHGGDVYINKANLLLVDNQYGNSVGIATTIPRCAVDFSNAGRFDGGVTQPYDDEGNPINNAGQAFFLPPTISTAERDGTGSYNNLGLSTAIGAVIYNTTINKLQVFTNQHASGGWETITSAYTG